MNFTQIPRNFCNIQKKDLRSHCVICRRWFRFPRNLSRHLLASHGDAKKEGMERDKTLDLRPCLKSCTCLVCGHTSSNSRNHWQHMDGRCMTLLQRCMARVPDPVTSSAYPDDEQVDCETQRRQQQQQQQHLLTSSQQHLPQHPHLPRQRSIEHPSSSTQHADSFYKFVRPSRCSTTRRLGRSSSPRSCQQACTHYPFNKPREEQGREGHRQGQGTEKGQKQEQGEGQGPVQQSWHLSRCNQNLRKGSQENIICRVSVLLSSSSSSSSFPLSTWRVVLSLRDPWPLHRPQAGRQTDRRDRPDQTRPGPNRPTNPPKPPHERTDTVLASTKRNCDSAPEGHVVFARKLAFCAPVASSVCLLEKAKSARHLEGTNPPASRATPYPALG